MVLFTRPRVMSGIYSLIRNLVCECFALGLVVSGLVRRARKQALSGSVITAIYFHKPTKRLFDRCIRWLIKHGYVFISSRDLLDILCNGKPFPKGAVWLSFDDGCKELLHNVLPLAHEHQIPITLFIPTGIVGGKGLFPWVHHQTSSVPQDVSVSTITASQNGSRDSMTVAELKQLTSRAEVTFGSHTVNHADTSHCAEPELGRELSESKRALESWTNVRIDSFSYPYGKFNGRERQYLIDFGYRLAATTENKFITPQTDLYLVPRFAVANDISFAEAICNMVGVWRPLIEAVKKPFGVRTGIEQI